MWFKVFSLAIIGMLLCGCGPTVWYHPYKSQEQFYADQEDCYKFAVQCTESAPNVEQSQDTTIQTNDRVSHTGKSREAILGESFGTGFNKGFMQKMYFEKCMKSKGYYQK